MLSVWLCCGGKNFWGGVKGLVKITGM